jgi:hypothetical protein
MQAIGCSVQSREALADLDDFTYVKLARVDDEDLSIASPEANRNSIDVRGG